MTIENKDWANWTQIMSVSQVEEEVKRVTRLRPGHADLPGTMKYGYDDVRNVLERASARETAARVAAGAVARRLLEEFGVQVHSHSLSIGGVWASVDGEIDWDAVEESPVRCADSSVEAKMMAVIDEAKEAGDTVGGVVEVVAQGVPIGLGSHVQWDRKIDGRLAQALMSIPACKAVSIGDGWESVNQPGSKVHDVIEPVTDPSNPWQRRTNRSGGTEGGMTSGMPLVTRFAIKPISTLRTPLPSVDLDTGELVQAHYERSDVCQVPPAGVIGEAMVALVLADAFMEKFGGDSVGETRRNLQGYLKTVGPRRATQGGGSASG
jgi:chorismate synthase